MLQIFYFAHRHTAFNLNICAVCVAVNIVHYINNNKNTVCCMACSYSLYINKTKYAKCEFKINVPVEFNKLSG